jgi:hypothetical protein
MHVQTISKAGDPGYSEPDLIGYLRIRSEKT